jgi:hypothetical protein
VGEIEKIHDEHRKVIANEVAPKNQVKIVPVKVSGTTYDTLVIMGVSCTLKGNKTRINIQLDGEIAVIPNTDVLSFVYGIVAGENAVQRPDTSFVKKVINLSGDKLPITISYAELITLALADANLDSDIHFSLTTV